MKTCNKCKIEKPTTEFYTSTNKKNGKVYQYPRGECKTCTSKSYKKRYIKQIREKGTAPNKWVSIRSKYNITKEQYEEMELKQNFKCLICEKPQKPYSLAVDHNHKTNKVRGLLCRPCNTGIGHLGDSPENIRKAYKYLVERGHYG